MKGGFLILVETAEILQVISILICARVICLPFHNQTVNEDKSTGSTNTLFAVGV
jgi:hypothetical protein